eukprot:scaffold367_cov254-Pinguiococcus_pyrenoidosus.AAC.22
MEVCVAMPSSEEAGIPRQMPQRSPAGQHKPAPPGCEGRIAREVASPRTPSNQRLGQKAAPTTALCLTQPPARRTGNDSWKLLEA